MQKVNKILIFFFFFFLFAISWFIPDTYDINFIKSVILITFLCTLFFLLFFIRKFHKIQFFSITILFLFGYILVHFQIPILYLFDNKIQFDYFEFFYWSNINVAPKSILYSSITLVSFYCGYIIKSYRKKEEEIAFNLISRPTYQFLIYIAYFAYFTFFILSPSYSSGLYDSSSDSSIGNYFILVFNIICQLLILYRTYLISSEPENFNLFTYLRKFDYKLILIVSWHILFSIFVGDRGPVIIYSILFFAPYLLFSLKKNSVIKISFFIIIVPFVLTVLGNIRTKQKVDKTFIERFTQANTSEFNVFFKNPDKILLSTTMELALSGRCLNHAINHVPSKQPYFNGIFQINHILSSVPFLAGFIQKSFFNNDKAFDGSANYITSLIQGRDVKYGDGTSCTADIYLDFGLSGLIICFFLFGYFVSYLDEIFLLSKNKTFFYWLIIMIFLSGAIYLSRAAIGLYIQRIIQIYLLYILVRNRKGIYIKS